MTLNDVNNNNNNNNNDNNNNNNNNNNNDGERLIGYRTRSQITNHDFPPSFSNNSLLNIVVLESKVA